MLRRLRTVICALPIFITLILGVLFIVGLVMVGSTIECLLAFREWRKPDLLRLYYSFGGH